MDSGSNQRISCQLQLLAINSLFEHARSGGNSEDGCSRAIREMIRLGEQIQTDPQSVRKQDLDDAQATILYHALLA